MMLLVITAIILTLTYNAVLISENKGVPLSLSHSFYIFGGKDTWGYIFYGYLVAMFMLLIVPMMEMTPEKWEFLPFLALGSLCFVGVAADFMDKDTNVIHVACAGISAYISISWCVVVGYYYIPIIFAVVAAYFIYKDTVNKIYYLEMGAFAAPLTILLFYYINN